MREALHSGTLKCVTSTGERVASIAPRTILDENNY